jgi:hypothetical protein
MDALLSARDVLAAMITPAVLISASPVAERRRSSPFLEQLLEGVLGCSGRPASPKSARPCLRKERG